MCERSYCHAWRQSHKKPSLTTANWEQPYSNQLLISLLERLHKFKNSLSLIWNLKKKKSRSFFCSLFSYLPYNSLIIIWSGFILYRRRDLPTKIGNLRLWLILTSRNDSGSVVPPLSRFRFSNTPDFIRFSSHNPIWPPWPLHFTPPLGAKAQSHKDPLCHSAKP